jgi:Spy/CpxP family protein refolding chaperone
MTVNVQEEASMKQASLLAWLFAVTILMTAGCGSHHHGMGYPGRGDEYAAEKGVQEMAALIDKTVQDPEKAKQVQTIVGDIITEVKHTSRQNRDYHRKLYELNANYEATPEDFTKILDEMNNNRMRSASKILVMRFKMKELLTAQEWKALSDGMNDLRGRYRHGKDAPEAGKEGA